MEEKLLTELRSLIEGDILSDEETLMTYSHDTSLFEVKPQVVVFVDASPRGAGKGM